LKGSLFTKFNESSVREHAVGQPPDLSHFQAHARRRQEKHLCNSGGAARFFFIQQNTRRCTDNRVG
jgi:hypothetical protein